MASVATQTQDHGLKSIAAIATTHNGSPATSA
jgi:hypothetical protein